MRKINSMKNNPLRTLLAITFLLSIAICSSAQVTYRDVVYLKTGTIIKGSVIEMVPGGNIKIKTSDGSIFVYKTEEVEKTVKEEYTSSTTRITGRKDKGSDSLVVHNGFFLFARVGPSVNEAFENYMNVAGGVIGGFQINKYLSLGLGAETTQYGFRQNAIRMYPIFFDARFFVPKGMVCPMFSFQFGYALAGARSIPDNSNGSSDFIPTKGKGGVFLSLGAGVRIAVTKQFSVFGDGGLAFQSLTGYEYSNNPISKTVAALRLNIGFGINIGKR